MPEISILLCAYNAEAYIAKAVESTLRQTFRDFELIIIDDGSTDGTLDIIKSYQDTRITVVEDHHDYIHSLNRGLRICRGRYIARMDADDIMEPTRLETQVALMDAHPEIAVCTSWAMAFDGAEGVVGNRVHGMLDNVNVLFLIGNFLIHPTSMIRRRFITLHHLHYREGYAYAEDFKLWTDIARKYGRFYVIPQPLLRYRITPTQVTHAHRQEQEETRLMIQQEIIEYLLQTSRPEFRKKAVKLYRQLLLAYDEGLLPADMVVATMFHVFRNMKSVQP